MGKSLTEIAEQLKGSNKKVQLIYAFNGTGKTRLSGEFKNLIEPVQKSQAEDLQEENFSTIMHLLRIYSFGIMIC